MVYCGNNTDGVRELFRATLQAELNALFENPIADAIESVRLFSDVHWTQRRSSVQSARTSWRFSRVFCSQYL